MPRIAIASSNLWSDEQRAAAAECILHLRHACDGAQKLDGHGFNKLHAASLKVAELVELAKAGPIPYREMKTAVGILATYKNTQLGPWAAVLWPVERGA